LPAAADCGRKTPTVGTDCATAELSCSARACFRTIIPLTMIPAASTVISAPPTRKCLMVFRLGSAGSFGTVMNLS